MAEFRLSTLGEVVEETGGRFQTGPFGTVLSASEYTPSGVPVISVGEVGYGRLKVDAETPKVDGSLTARLPEYVLHSGDIVFARKGAVDRVAWVTPEQDGWFLGSDGIMVRVGEAVNAQFLAYQLQSQRARRWLLQHAAGSTMASLNQRVLSALPVAIPGLPTQDAIADVLGALDEKIAVNMQLAVKAEQLAQALFRARVGSADQVSFSSRLTPVLGGTPKRSDPSFWGGQNLWISATDVTGADHGVVIDTKEKISDKAVARTKAKPLPRGSVILTARGTVGAVARLAEPASFNQSAYGFRPGGLPPALLYFAVLDAARQAANFVHGSVFDTITMRTFDDLTVPDIPAAEADALEMKLSPLLDVVEHVVRENATLAATRDALLPGLMSGRLRVRDAEGALERLV